MGCTIHKELRRKGVSLMLLWYEYKAGNPEGYQYSQFCYHYRQWCGKLDPVMRQEHQAGDKLFVDYSGITVPITDPGSGGTYEAQIFIACMRASNYTCAEAPLTRVFRTGLIPMSGRWKFWRRSRTDHPRQPQKWRQQNMPVRTGSQPDLSIHCQSL